MTDVEELKDIKEKGMEKMMNKSPCFEFPEKQAMGKTLSICPYCKKYGAIVVIKDGHICEDCLELIKK